MMGRIPIPRIRQLNLRNAVGMVPYTTGVAALVSVALVAVKTARHPGFTHARLVIALAGSLFLVALLVSWRLHRSSLQLPASIHPSGAISWVLAVQLGVLLLTVPVIALVKNIEADNIMWTWPYLETMMINAPLRAALVEHIRTRPADYESFIGTSLEAPEAKAFLDAHPGAERLVRHLGPTPVYILLSRREL